MKKYYKIKENKIMCNHCKDVIQSLFVHDFKYCRCKSVYVDGGCLYLRRGYINDSSDYKELSVLEEANMNDYNIYGESDEFDCFISQEIDYNKFMEIKYLSRKKWKNIIDKKYIHEYIENEYFQGEIALIHLIKVERERISHIGNESITWMDHNYYWLEVAPKNDYYWLTVMFNEKGEIVQYYFDITDKNVIDEKNDSYFYDLYLDLVVSNREVYVLDEEDLNQAYIQNGITEEQYQKAIHTKNQLVELIQNHYDDLEKSCYQYFNDLKEKLYDLCNE